MQKKLKRSQQKSKLKAGFLKKINKIDKPLARLIKKQREKNQINKIRNEKFLEKYNFPKLNQEEREDLNRPITSQEIEAVIRNKILRSIST